MLNFRWLVALGVAVFAASCAQPTDTPVPETTEAAVPTERMPSPTPELAEAAVPTENAPAPTPEPVPSVEALPEDEGCADTEGRMVQDELHHPDLPRSLPYRVYLPACAMEGRGQLPSLYLLHGLARTDAQWDDLEADEVANALVAADQAPPFLIVMPWERLGLDYQQTIVDYLIPHIESKYGASSDRSLRSIGGISRGAGWALRIGLQYPELFQAIGLHSPAVLVPDIYALPGWIEALPSGQTPEIWIDIGDRDPLRLSLPELTSLFDESEITYVLRSFPGEHIEAYWADHVKDYLRWYISGWLDRERGGEFQ